MARSCLRRACCACCRFGAAACGLGRERRDAAIGGSIANDAMRLTLLARSSQCGGGDTGPPTAPKRSN
jgi:hypothetical protein